MQEEYGKVSLETIGGGAAVEKFQMELDAVIKNIADPNTNPEAIREITLTVKIKPNQARELGTAIVTSKSKLAPTLDASTVIYFGRDKGRPVAYESNRKQTEMFNDDGNVVSIDRETGEIQ